GRPCLDRIDSRQSGCGSRSQGAGVIAGSDVVTQIRGSGDQRRSLLLCVRGSRRSEHQAIDFAAVAFSEQVAYGFDSHGDRVFVDVCDGALSFAGTPAPRASDLLVSETIERYVGSE